MNRTLPLARLGIVGGGQLARMLAPACNALHVRMAVLDPTPDSPAGQVASEQIVGDLHDPDALRRLCDRSDMVTFDLEDVGAAILETLADRSVRMVPAPRTIRLIQNKLEQKRHYRRCGLPTTAFAPLPEQPTWADVEAFGVPCVQKAVAGGYDGRGVHIIRGPEDWDGRLRGPSFLEVFVPDAVELSVMVARRPGGDMVAYDPVEMVADPALNLLDYLLAPARVPVAVAAQAEELARDTVASFETGGLFGVELFLDRGGALWVNEVAPRAHNSGHHTIEACVTSQFENQLRACLDLPLGDTTLRAPALTMNLVGADGPTGTPVLEGLEALAATPDAHLHLYGKATCRPGRKMGHVTLMAADQSTLLDRAANLRRTLKIRGGEAR